MGGERDNTQAGKGCVYEHEIKLCKTKQKKWVEMGGERDNTHQAGEGYCYEH